MAVMRLTLVHQFGPSKYRPTTWLDWDPEAGTVAGPIADEIHMEINDSMRLADGALSHTWFGSGVDLTHRLSKEPLKSYRDMAAILNDFEYGLPDILQPHFPPITKEQIEERRPLEEDPLVMI